MPDGSFRDLSAGNGSGNGRGAAVSSFGTSGGGGSTLNNGNYSTFFAADPSVRTLLRTSDSIEQTRRTVNESEQVAKTVLVDLELQRSQLHDMKDMVSDTHSMTGQVRHYLQIIADRSYRRKVVLWAIIVALAVTDILVFYLLFVR